MRTAPTLPYLAAPDDAVSADFWTTETGAELPERLEHWDPFTDMAVTRTIVLDLDAVREGCRLGADASFAVTASWYSTATRLSDSAAVELADLSGLVRATVSLVLPGPRIGGRVTLRARLILRHPGSAATLISPRIPGTILWRDEVAVEVEGASARFPMAVADFTATRHPTESAWVLEWDNHDLEQPLLGGLRLLLNSAHPTLTSYLRTGVNDPAASLIQSFVTYDVARTLIFGALRNERFLAAPRGFEEDTVGRAVSELIDSCFPGVPTGTLATWTAESPDRVETVLQAALRTLQ